MKVDDILNGVLFQCLGIGIVIYAQGMPAMAHIDYGPGFLPGLVGYGFILSGTALIIGRVCAGSGVVQGLLQFRSSGMKSVVGFLLIVGMVLIYAFVSNVIGFLLVTPFLLFAGVYWFERRAVLAVVVGIVGTLALHTFFYQIMQAPLPWGVLEPWSGHLSW